MGAMKRIFTIYEDGRELQLYICKEEGKWFCELAYVDLVTKEVIRKIYSNEVGEKCQKI